MHVCERLFKTACQNGAELVVFPELSLTGFSLDTSLAECGDGETVRFFTQLAENYGAACVFGYAEKSGDKIRNILAAVDKNGNITAKYAKLHPFSLGGEADIFTAGELLSCFDVGDMRFGLSICYDLRFPELYRQLSKNCGCLIVSADWAAERTEHWLALLKARAIENQCYVIGCNCCCDVGMKCGGSSVIYDPDGKLLSAATEKEQLVFAEISDNSVQKIRSSFPQMSDRRNDIYRNFYE